MDADLTEDEIKEVFSGIFEKPGSNELHIQNLRFATTSEAEIEQYLQDRVPSNTKSKQRWCDTDIYCLRR